MATTVASCLAATARYSGSAKPEMSLPTTAPAPHAASSTDARQVSTETRHVEARAQRLDRGNDAVELLGLADLGPGTRLHAPDVEQVGAVGDERLGAPQERVELPGRAAVVERVGRAVEDAHHQRRAGARRSTGRRAAASGTERRSRSATVATRLRSTGQRPSAPIDPGLVRRPLTDDRHRVEPRDVVVRELRRRAAPTFSSR